MQVTQKERPALREQSGHKNNTYDGSHSSAGCRIAPAWLTVGKKIAPHGGESGRGQYENQSNGLPLERRQALAIRQVGPAGLTVGKKKAPHGGYSVGPETFRMIMPTERRCSQGAAQVWRDALDVDGRLKPRGNGGYTVGAAAKSAAGIRTPSLHMEPTHAPIAWFFVGARSPFTWVLLAYPAFGIYSVMVARVGQPLGWPVSSMCAGSTNPIRATTMRFVPLCGSDNLLHMEAAIMATVPTPVTPEIQLVNGKAVTSSLALANYFGKNHYNVLRKIQLLDCSLEFTALNFEASTYIDPTGRECPCYLLTRDGFFFVAMGFTGQRAAEFKEAYIAAFNALEQRLALPAYPVQLDEHALRETVQEAKHCFGRITPHWQGTLYPALVLVQSPLAPELHDWFEMLGWKLNSLAHLVGARRPTLQGGRRHDY